MGLSFDFVTPRLATGAGVTSKEAAQELMAAGITHVIDATDDEDDTTALGAAAFTGGYLYNPTADDGTPKEPPWFARSLGFALPAFAASHSKVYAHCTAGINRGPSTAYCIMRALGWTPNEAYSLIVAARPIAHVRYRGDADRAIAALGFA